MFYACMSVITTIASVIVARISGLGAPYVYEDGDVSYLLNGVLYLAAGVFWPLTITCLIFLGVAELLGFLGAP